MTESRRLPDIPAHELVVRKRRECGLGDPPHHQIMLLGSNPLPCYVAALALKPQRVTIVTSTALADLATRLQSALAQAGIQCDVACTLADPSDSREVASVVRGIEGIEAAGLHYTGGQKTMAVHAYAAWRERGGLAQEASYIDAGRAELRFDGTGAAVPLHDHPVVDFDALVRLHGLDRVEHHDRPEGSTQALCEALVSDLRRLRLEGFREIWPPPLVLAAPGAGRSGPRMSKDEMVKCPPLDHDLSDLNAVATALGEVALNLGTFIERCTGVRAPELQAQPLGKKLGRRIEPAIKWLDGTWLDEFTWLTLWRLRDSHGLHSIYHTISAKGPPGDDREFELDVCCMRGHTLFALSCTTGDKPLAKLKLFEAQTRARQLGGDHARYAVVTLLEDGERANLEHQVRQTLNVPGEARVFGWGDVVGDFAGALGNWIAEAHRP